MVDSESWSDSEDLHYKGGLKVVVVRDIEQGAHTWKSERGTNKEADTEGEKMRGLKEMSLNSFRCLLLLLALPLLRGGIAQER